jgi:hypothetical protein
MNFIVNTITSFINNIKFVYYSVLVLVCVISRVIVVVLRHGLFYIR